MSELANTGIKNPSLVSELALARDRELDEIIARWDNGEPADAAAILLAAPHLAASRSAVIELAYEEYCQRKDLGERVVVDDFVAKFPQHETAVRRIIALEPLDRDPRTPQRLPPGTEVRQYEVVDWLGRGAFSQVYLACDHSLAARAVVLKVTRFSGIEAEALATVESPYVVPVYAATKDEVERQTTIVMPFFGPATFEDLAERLRKTPRARGKLIFDVAATSAALDPRLPPATMPTEYARRPFQEGIVWLLRGVAEGLSKAHSCGFLHLDLKPSNILLAAGACPMLADFNLSQRSDEQWDEVGGTVPYMAPEQLRRFLRQKEVPLTAAADVYALGVIAHELLTGEHPYGPIDKEKSGEALAGDLLTKLASPRRRPIAARRLNPSLRRLIDQCLDVDPTRRPTSEQVRSRLTRELGATASVVRKAARHPLVAWLIGCLVVAAIAFGVYAWNHPYRAVLNARSAIKQGDYLEAIQLLEPYIGDTTNIELQSLYIYVCVKKGEWSKATAVGQSLYERGDRTVANLNNYGFALTMTGKHRLAESIMNDRDLPENLHPAFLYNRAMLAIARVPFDSEFDPKPGLMDAINARGRSNPCGELSRLIARLRVYVSKKEPQSNEDILADLHEARENGISQKAILDDHLFAAMKSLPGFIALADIKGDERRRQMDTLILPPRPE
jgi:serine/threonine protein kinase